MAPNLWVEVLFWTVAFLVFYTYLGYGIIMWLMVRVHSFLSKERTFPFPNDNQLPEVTFLVAAWNEAPWIRQKIRNSLAFDYPPDRIHFFFVTDGSTDGTPDIIRAYDLPEGVQLSVFHHTVRAGKIAAVERVMPYVRTPVVVFSDANTYVNPEAIRRIVGHYTDERVGAVAGEKRVRVEDKASATVGEGLYWRYESWLKKLDSDWHTVVGAAGELFSIRTELFEPVPPDTIVEDLFLTMRIAARGYLVRYAPDAYAEEEASASIREEMKRKVRIAAGGFQALFRLRKLLNPFRYGKLSFQFLSHRVLRWTVGPLSIPLLFLLNLLLIRTGAPVYRLTFWLQMVFYLMAISGWVLEQRQLKFKPFFIPYYFCFMNYAIFRGFWRSISGKQSVLWERARRSDE